MVALSGLELDCYVLNDLRRVFTQRGMVLIITGGRESGDLTRYLDSNPLINRDIFAGRRIQFKIPGNPTTANGFEATALGRIGLVF